MSSFEACAAGVKQVEADLGPVDVLVNNAGITRDAQLHRMKPEQWTTVINTNLSSLFNMSRQVIEGMRQRKFGRIINISSINGQKGQFGQTNYSAAKAGEIGFTKALAQEGARVGVTSMRSLRAISTPRWYRRCRKRCWRASCRSTNVDISCDKSAFFSPPSALDEAASGVLLFFGRASFFWRGFSFNFPIVASHCAS